MKIDCIIIEDEPLAVERLTAFIAQVPYLNPVATYYSALEAIGYLKAHKPALIFLDIEMDGLSGLQLIESLEISSQIIITTAYEKYALKGYELNITDYLLKPFPFDRFLKAVEKAHHKLRQNAAPKKDFFFVKIEYRLEKIFYKDVLYIEGIGDYRKIITAQAPLLTLQTFHELETLLPKEKICRVHKSFMVAIDKIDALERNRVRIKDKLIPVSDTYKRQFYEVAGIGEEG